MRVLLKALGPDGITHKVLEVDIDLIIACLTRILNRNLKLKHCRSAFRDHVLPLQKMGEREYRFTEHALHTVTVNIYDRRNQGTTGLLQAATCCWSWLSIGRLFFGCRIVSSGERLQLH